MKITDYAPRSAPFDAYVIGLRRSGLVGVEVGVDAGAHAAALLRLHCVGFLSLVDPWPNIERRGYCDGRLSPYVGRFELLRMTSVQAAERFAPASLDFVYLDQETDGATVAKDLQLWFPKLRSGGILGRRGYVADRGGALELAVDRFVEERGLQVYVERYLSDVIIANA